jgi:hypothetical protein
VGSFCRAMAAEPYHVHRFVGRAARGH